MTEALVRYRELENELVFVRWVNRGMESEAEDHLLDKMEQAWWELDAEERRLLQSEPPRSPIREGSVARPPRRLVDSDKELDPAAPPRRTEEAA